MKSFDEYIKIGIVKKVSRDKGRAISLLNEAKRKLRSLQEKLEKIGVRDDNANDYVEYCYDTLMVLIRAKMYLEGYTTSGKGAYEAEVSFMKTLGFKEEDIRFMDKMRYFRNGILYYGSTLDKEYAKKVVTFTKNNYSNLKNMVH